MRVNFRSILAIYELHVLVFTQSHLDSHSGLWSCRRSWGLGLAAPEEGLVNEEEDVWGLLCGGDCGWLPV